MPVRPLCPELAELTKNIFKEDPETLQNGLQHIKDWLAEQPHITANTDDQWLASFIRGCDFKLDIVKQKLDLYYTCRGTAPEFYQLHHKDVTFKELFNIGYYLPLPKLKSPAAPRVSLIQTGLFDLTPKRVLEAFCVSQIIQKILIMDDDNSMVAGNICVIDLKNTNIFNMIVQMNTTQLKKLLACQQDAVPFGICKIIVINLCNNFEILKAIKVLLDNEFKKRFFIYSSYEEMYNEHNDVPREIMPVEYGGSGGTLQEIIDSWNYKIDQYDDWLENDLQYCVDESKRPGNPATAQDMFGVDPLVDLFDLVKNLGL